MRLLLDTSIPQGATEALVAAGHDVVCVGDLPKGATASDTKVLEAAARQGRILVTRDQHLGEHELLLGAGHRLLRIGNFKLADQTAAILHALAEHGAEMERGAVVTVEPGQLRVRPFTNGR
ncbi:MAG: hypothetical protein NFCOHLIN_01951 [Gammaproteobacteria bacterium]|nr:hypothetical protein [Gammaproteobacteria bacterium]